MTVNSWMEGHYCSTYSRADAIRKEKAVQKERKEDTK